MELNSNFSLRAAVHAAKEPWTPSPVSGVVRRMLDRVGGELARSTSIVRFDPKSHFTPHVHGGGEEFLVLDGVFSDEEGDFFAGSYVRNPPLTRHTPRSETGCTLFVKLWQFDPADRRLVRVNTAEDLFKPDPRRAGVEFARLYSDLEEEVQLERWGAVCHRLIAGSERHRDPGVGR
jgi:anti-sigma factor ChrR (cupin superfamily)